MARVKRRKVSTKRKRRVPYNFEHEKADQHFWSRIIRKSILSNSKRCYNKLVKRRENFQLSKFKKFKRKFVKISTTRKRNKDLLKALQFWVKYASWTYCQECELLHPNKLTPQALRSKGCRNLSANRCPCSSTNYSVPKLNEIPQELLDLTADDVELLRLFKIDSGKKSFAKAGHRIKNGAFELVFRADSVVDRINQVSNVTRKDQLQKAYDYLVNSNLSHYKQYLRLQNSHPAGTKIKFWTVNLNMPGIECALWPSLYPFSKWCETLLSSTKDSILKSFRIKLLSTVIDYNNNFELLQFHYDRWLFKTLTGAINTGKILNCSPLRSLETKPFTPGYWRWQHLFLLDAVQQFGNPTLFITISPSEWDFPKASWLENYLKESGSVPTRSGALETFHIAHILDQIARGFIAGTNTRDWESHEIKHFCYASRNSKPSNVQCVFYRFEYQGRRTIHIHILLWLKSLIEMNNVHRELKATVPKDNIDDSFLITRLQSSNKPSPFLQVRSEPTVTIDSFQPIHRNEDSDLNLRAYMDTIIKLLKSSMDVQATDGKGALLRYVTTYVTKLHENVETLRNVELSTFRQALPFLIDLFPGEPEMAMCFSSNKISYSNLSRVKLVPALPEYLSSNSIFTKYVNRHNDLEELSALEFCREFSVNVDEPHLSDHRNLVGVKFKYIFNPLFLYQYTIVNKPFRHLSDLEHPMVHLLPDNLKWFSYFIQNFPTLGLSYKFSLFLEKLGYNDLKIREFRSHFRGLQYLFNNFFTRQPNSSIRTMNTETVLNDEQTNVYRIVKRSINKEVSFEINYSSDSEDEFCYRSAPDTIQIEEDSQQSIKPFLITGKPGTGKTLLIHKLINYCIDKERQVLFSSPTANLARRTNLLFNSKFLDCDTVHASFCIPIDGSKPKINVALFKYCLIVIEEVGMIPYSSMIHIMNSVNTIPSKTCLLLVGDQYQQSPIGTEESSKTNIFHTEFLMKCTRFNLLRQHRIECHTLDNLLTLMRSYYLTQKEVNILNSMVIYPDANDIYESIIHAHSLYPYTKFLTITRTGSRTINDCLTQHLNVHSRVLRTVLDSEFMPVDLYEGMPICITENIDKHNGIVNGQQAEVISCRYESIIIKLPDDTEYFIYERFDEEKSKHFFPILVNYSSTIYKSQGSNLDHITVWLDRKKPSPGAAYVAFSRVKYFKNIRLLEPVNRFQIVPIRINLDESSDEDDI